MSFAHNNHTGHVVALLKLRQSQDMHTTGYAAQYQTSVNVADYWLTLITFAVAEPRQTPYKKSLKIGVAVGRAISSVGKSAPLIRVRSLVRIQDSPRGYSSVGRALPLQGRCQRFESAYLHQFPK